MFLKQHRAKGIVPRSLVTKTLAVMQTALQKIGELFKNMLSTYGGHHPQTPHLQLHKIACIINDANVVERSP